MSDAWFVMRDS